MTIGDAKRFLSPIRPIPNNHGSAVPVGANEDFFHNIDKQYITGFTNMDMAGNANGDKFYPYQPESTDIDVKRKTVMKNREELAGPSARGEQENDQKFTHHAFLPNEQRTDYEFKFPVFDVTMLCSSWAAAVTSAMSITVSRWSDRFMNFSLQYVLDCDMLGDSCIERTPLNAYQLFWERHPVTYDDWDKADGTLGRSDPMEPPRNDFTKEHCKDEKCFPGTASCTHYWALTGSCNPGQPETNCPVYFLYNWRWIKSHLWEVGAVTSSIIVYPELFSYESGVYSSTYNNQGDSITPQSAIGMLDVTIIGWGQTEINLSDYDDGTYKGQQMRWWWIIPHFGYFRTGGFDKQHFEGHSDTIESGNYIFDTANLKGTGPGGEDDLFKAVIAFNRRWDDCSIETHAVGAVPVSFVPHPWRTPEETAED